MKKLFNTYYEYTKEEYDEIWGDGIFVLDANVLLNLYRYTEDTRKELLEILYNISDRLWIPHQIGLEYHSNRVSVILEQIVAFDQITASLSKSSQTVISGLSKDFKKFKKRHPSIKIDSITEKIDNYFNNLIKETKQQKEAHPNLLEHDNILEIITDLFKDKIGDSYDQNQLNEIFREGEERYKNQRPPGYEDSNAKKGSVRYYNDLIIKNEYGDLIVWKQIIEKAKNEKKPIVFITDDVKSDWWETVSGRTLGPKDELVNEFKFETNQNLVMYNTERFMRYASESLKSKLSPEAIEEVEKLNKADRDDHFQEFQEWMENIEKIDKKMMPKNELAYNLLAKNHSYFFKDHYMENLKEIITEELLHEIYKMMQEDLGTGVAKKKSELNTIMLTILNMYHPYLELNQINTLCKLILDKLIERKLIFQFVASETVLYFIK
ncbi:PIN-like domain-containing protein [Priestia megaterium]|uniref:PIN-like domain-containing protein n=1 Tax=Priestia megaterium TaxID=1404 RepID=UPI003009FAA3